MNLRTFFCLLATLASLTSQGAETSANPPPAESAAQPEEGLSIEAPEGDLSLELRTGEITYTNGVIVKYGPAILAADRVRINQETGDTAATGNVVLIREGGLLWRGDQLTYNFKTRVISGTEFRAGAQDYFITAEKVVTEPTNNAYVATNATFTTDDHPDPNYRIRAKKLIIIPGKSLEARHATLYAGDVPVFYYPYYKKSLDRHPNNFEFTPGFRSTWGPFLLSSYNWYWDRRLSGALNLDFRGERGFAGGPDLRYRTETFGEAMMSYYIADDWDPRKRPGFERPSHQRERLLMSYQGTVRTNLNVRGQLSYENDPLVRRDFFETEYHRDVQPKTYIEAEQQWRNWTLDLLAQPRVNDFQETVERLPDVKLTGLRQQLGNTPLYYEGESSLGYYRRLFPDMETNRFYPVRTNDYAAGRADSLHQVLLPWTFFGFLNVTPRAGYRATWYSEADGRGTTAEEETRDLFATGTEVSWKASRVYRDAENELLDVNGLRHIIQPSFNYVFIPDPDVDPHEIPQFDRRLPSSRLLPIDFPELNTIDTLDYENTVRLGLRNRLQTKREDGMDDLLSWAVYTDWHLKQREDQDSFSDVYSDLEFKPRSWILFDSETRYSVEDGQLEEALHQVTVQPGETWSFQVGHLFRQRSRELGIGNDLFRTTLYYRLNENWGFRTSHYFEARSGVMEYQYYTVYRDFRSWTGSLTLRMRENDDGGSEDVTVALMFSLKAAPRFGVGDDAVRPNRLVGR